MRHESEDTDDSTIPTIAPLVHRVEKDSVKDMSPEYLVNKPLFLFLV